MNAGQALTRLRDLASQATVDQDVVTGLHGIVRGALELMTWVEMDEDGPVAGGPYLVHIPTVDPEKPMVWIAWWHPEARVWEGMPGVSANNVTHWMSLPGSPA